jgi:O-acetyl-ADP-ribose deacetylase (regulator of RNase III)
MEVRIGEAILHLVKGDITDLSVDAIVNAANRELKLGGGVAGAIRRKGGPHIQEECDIIIAERGHIPTGGAVITSGGNLKAKHVIHAVGPISGEGDEDKKLRNATLNSLKLADQYGLKSIAFPAVSTGYFGLPRKKCAEVMLPAAISYINTGTNLEQIIFCLYDEETFSVFKETLGRVSKINHCS